MQAALSADENPFDASLETILPGVHSRLEVIAGQQASQAAILSSQATLMREAFAAQEIRSNEREDRLLMSLSGFFQAASSAFALSANSSGADPTVTDSATTKTTTNAVAVSGTMMAAATGGSGNETSVYLSASYKSLVHIWDEWYGVHTREGRPVQGGLSKLEETTGGRWRSHFSPAEGKKLSRIRAIIKCVETYTHSQAEMAGKERDILASWDLAYKGQCRFSLSNFVTFLQEQKLMPKQKPRGRTVSDRRIGN